ncbi:ASCH domain-containing protein [Xenorhabdus khoisanae]|uniref:ASCH domain-containing protein n=1 Tax=Xenorhabdus khoisanae TaxID=880157 RepID=UPI0032B7F3A7
MKLLKFNTEMIDAILSGRKTQTRRLIEPQPKVTDQELRNLGTWANELTLSQRVDAAWQAGFIGVPCPYGETGDIINFTDKDGNIKGKIEITDVWVERLMDISEEDARSEGVSGYGIVTDQLTGEINCQAIDVFDELWKSIYGIDSWDSSPWIWVIEFRRIE